MWALPTSRFRRRSWLPGALRLCEVKRASGEGMELGAGWREALTWRSSRDLTVDVAHAEVFDLEEFFDAVF